MPEVLGELPNHSRIGNVVVTDLLAPADGDRLRSLPQRQGLNFILVEFLNSIRGTNFVAR